MINGFKMPPQPVTTAYRNNLLATLEAAEKANVKCQFYLDRFDRLNKQLERMKARYPRYYWFCGQNYYARIEPLMEHALENAKMWQKKHHKLLVQLWTGDIAG